MKKLFNEFKKFISRGNALDLAVGMIIGAAFTAIVTALVNGILKPLINLIPVGNEQTLQYVLREANEVTGADAIILDFGAVISAVITFILTALVLFIIIKAINKAKEGNNDFKKKIKRMSKKGQAELEAQEAKEIEAQKAAEETAKAQELAEAAEKAKEEAQRANQEKTVALLEQIVEMLKNK